MQMAKTTGNHTAKKCINYIGPFRRLMIFRPFSAIGILLYLKRFSLMFPNIEKIVLCLTQSNICVNFKLRLYPAEFCV